MTWDYIKFLSTVAFALLLPILVYFNSKINENELRASILETNHIIIERIQSDHELRLRELEFKKITEEIRRTR